MDFNLRKTSLIIALIFANLVYGLTQTKSNDSTIFDTLRVQTENIDVQFFKKSNYENNGENGINGSTSFITTSGNIFKSVPSELYDEAEKLNEYSFKVYVQFNLKPDGKINDANIIRKCQNKGFNTFISNHLEELIEGINTSKNPDFFYDGVSNFVIPIYLNYK